MSRFNGISGAAIHESGVTDPAAGGGASRTSSGAAVNLSAAHGNRTIHGTDGSKIFPFGRNITTARAIGRVLGVEAVRHDSPAPANISFRDQASREKRSTDRGD